MVPVREVEQSLAEGGAAVANGSTVPDRGTAPNGDSTSVLTIIGVITSQMVGITALLYYFGWVRTDSSLYYFGVDPSLAGYGTSDYVLRSIAVTFPPFISAALIALVLFGLHRLIVMPTLENAESGSTTAPAPAAALAPVADTATDPAALRPVRSAVVRAVRRARALARCRPGTRGMRWFVGVVHVAGAALTMVVLTGVLLPEQIGVPLGYLLPLVLVAAVALLGYVKQLRLRYPASLAATDLRYAAPASRTYSLILLALGLVAVIWAVGLYGVQVGIDRAIDIADHLSELPSVTIYSTERISIAGPGVVAVEITQPGSKYHYQYRGLRLMLHSPDKYLLLPVGWRHGQDPVFVLRDDKTIRVDITAQ